MKTVKQYRAYMLAGLMIVVSAGILAFTAVNAASSTSSDASASPQNDLQFRIQEKSKELQTINEQLASTTKDLNQTKQQRVSLQRELSSLQNNVNQLNLNIKVDTVNIEKLGLEIESLGYDITDIEASIETKRAAIGQILREIQQRSSENFLAVMLKNTSLADAVQEAQTYQNLQIQLTNDIVNLRSLHDSYSQKLTEVGDKKGDVTYHQKNLQNQKLILQDQKDARQTLLVQTKNKESIYQQQLKELAKRQQEIAAEIEGIESELRKNINPNLLPPPRPGVLLWPVGGGGRITQGYGSTAFALQSYAGKFHNGVDIGGRPIGTEILSAEDGTVINIGDQDKFCPRGAYGKFIVIKHKDGLTTLYGHLSRYIVTIGQSVTRGQAIGYLGKTGYATGPHLHFTVFATQTLPPAIGGNPEGTKPSRFCGPMPVGGDISPLQYLDQTQTVSS